jgi:hypothetical protein
VVVSAVIGCCGCENASAVCSTRNSCLHTTMCTENFAVVLYRCVQLSFGHSVQLPAINLSARYHEQGDHVNISHDDRDV